MSAGDDDATCPLCMDILDPFDAALFPCPCRYQVCLWCVHHIREQMNGQCPACRREYNEDDFFTDETIKEEVLQRQKEKEAKAKEAALLAEKEAAASKVAPRNKENDRKLIKKLKEREKDLAHVRVIQRNVLHVMGIAPSVAKAEILRRAAFFGQYGKLLKVTVNRATSGGGQKGTTAQVSYSAYLTFEQEDDAKTAMQAVDGFEVDNHTLRVTYGTTRYCQSFIKDQTCTKTDCQFLHNLLEKKPRQQRPRRDENEGQEADMREPEYNQNAKGDYNNRRKGKGESKGEKGKDEKGDNKDGKGNRSKKGKDNKGSDKGKGTSKGKDNYKSYEKNEYDNKTPIQGISVWDDVAPPVTKPNMSSPPPMDVPPPPSKPVSNGLSVWDDPTPMNHQSKLTSAPSRPPHGPPPSMPTPSVPPPTRPPQPSTAQTSTPCPTKPPSMPTAPPTCPVEPPPPPSTAPPAVGPPTIPLPLPPQGYGPPTVPPPTSAPRDPGIFEKLTPPTAPPPMGGPNRISPPSGPPSFAPPSIPPPSTPPPPNRPCVPNVPTVPPPNIPSRSPKENVKMGNDWELTNNEYGQNLSHIFDNQNWNGTDYYGEQANGQILDDARQNRRRRNNTGTGRGGGWDEYPVSRGNGGMHWQEANAADANSSRRRGKNKSRGTEQQWWSGGWDDDWNTTEWDGNWNGNREQRGDGPMELIQSMFPNTTKKTQKWVQK